jgi:pyruvate dehydrogenase E2 component (dihydrolipoamide acetyltransferase)
MTDIVLDPFRWESMEAGESALLRCWLAAEGDHVRAGQPLAQATVVGECVDITAAHAGMLEEILVPAGQTFAPGRTLGRLVTF